ncbi:hypothetical protein F7725_017650 [Dissostichus mawsoni]|uniref:Uncharacterized protein n=1 Tax=Dissostichus mawsoni TaxID=36200 RepID=A0A7J5Z884_DISMA|nr:hypothetical protein F7725_017650 [Dissostichus mawsoni]
MEEEAACLMTEEEAGPSTQVAANEGPQPLRENAEEQATTVEEKLQSQQRRIMQLEIQLEESKAKQSYCRDKYSASQLSEKKITTTVTKGHFTTSTAEDPTRPSGDAPNNPVWESHKPDSWTCIWVAVGVSVQLKLWMAKMANAAA